MKRHTQVPPIKCQGIKTKLVEDIRRIATPLPSGRWIEPFCGSCVAALNILPKRALLCDSNIHIIRFYNDIKSGIVNPKSTRSFLFEEAGKLREGKDSYYYEVRERFNDNPNSFDFLFLNRACFNGVMRFNRRGRFNVPFCHKPDRFAPAYITKIVNQVRAIVDVLSGSDWEFRVADFRESLSEVKENDFVYADPPYAGRHVDYFNSWSEKDEADLAEGLSKLKCQFALSTWHSNEFRSNSLIETNWSEDRFYLYTREHYYHVGSTEDLRHPMIEALITNFHAIYNRSSETSAQPELLLCEHKIPYCASTI
jgi:DNA adenine methylase